MQTKRSNCAAAVHDGKLYVVGGKDGSGAALTSVEVYDFVTEGWCTMCNEMTTARTDLTVVVHGDRVLAIFFLFTRAIAIQDVAGLELKPGSATNSDCDCQERTGSEPPLVRVAIPDGGDRELVSSR
jgi:hypothetical protein